MRARLAPGNLRSDSVTALRRYAEAGKSGVSAIASRRVLFTARQRATTVCETPRRCGRVPGRESRDSREPLVRDGARFPAQAPALCAHPREASANALLNARPLELRDRAEDAGDEPAGRRAGVDPLAQRDERDPARVPVVEQHHQVPKVPAETIETPAHDGLHPMAPARLPRAGRARAGGPSRR